MTIRGFNQDVIEPYYVANLLSADPHDIDVFHCGIHLVCRHSAVQTVLSGISANTPHYDVVSKCMRNLMAMNPDFSEFTMFKDEWNSDNPEVPFAPIMGAVSPVLAETLRGVYDEKMQSEPDSSEVEELFRTHFALNSTEIEIVRFIYFLNTFAYGIYEGTRSRRRPKQVIKKISDATLMPFQTAAEHLATGSRLRAINFLFYSEKDFSSCETPVLAHNVITFIEGITSRKDIVDKYSTIDSREVYALESFSVSGENTGMLRRMISSQHPFQILLYGEPGTGKTEFSKALAASADKRARFVCSSGIQEKDEFNRLWALHVTLNISSDNDLIIVDEADAMLNTETYFDAARFDKGNLNNLFDSLNRTIIWITNDISRMHPSLLRRFAFSVRFDQMNAYQRERIWKVESDKYSLPLADSTIRQLSQHYDVNAAGIAHASHITSLLEEKSTESTAAALNQVLLSHNELIHGGIRMANPSRHADIFDAKYLNTDIPVHRIISTAARIKEKGAGSQERKLAAIFYGLPGTGKSETARFIADELSMKLVQKKYSDLESKWVGETEQNIAKAFREAEDSNAILFLDEADALFSERSSEKRGWEISRTNELLAQIDSFRGILICCTNLIDLMDSAAFRRFAFKVEFRPAGRDQRKDLYLHFFGERGELSKDQEEKVCAIDMMTPGDLSAVAASFMYEDKPSHDEIIEALGKECGFKKKGVKGTIGF